MAESTRSPSSPDFPEIPPPEQGTMGINPLFEDTARPRIAISFTPEPPSSPPLPPEPLATEIPLSPFQSESKPPLPPLPPRPPRIVQFQNGQISVTEVTAYAEIDPNGANFETIPSPSRVLKSALSRDSIDGTASGLASKMTASKRNVSWADLSNTGASLTVIKEYQPECPPGSPMSDGSWGSGDHVSRGCTCSIM